MTYYIEKNGSIVLHDDNRQRLANTLAFMPEYSASDIQETNGHIVDGVILSNEEYEQKQTQDIINQYDTAIEQWLDSTVQQRNYKNAESCISYEGDANPKYAREAEAVKAWRSAVYTQAEVLIAQYIGGDIADVPPIETIIAELPQLDWNDPIEPAPEEVSGGETN